MCRREFAVSAIISSKLLAFMLRLAFFFEPLAPQAIEYLANRSLRDWKRKGLVSKYKARTKRLGRFHYKLIVEMEVNSDQTHYLLGHLLPTRFEVIGRWFNG
jgi:hypothetical protein